MIKAILRLLDLLIGLHEPKTSDPPEPADWSLYKNSNELCQLYIELGNEMRALRSTEFSVAALFYTVAGLLFAGNLTILSAEKLSDIVKIISVLSTSVFLTIFWLSVHARIAHDNASYAHLMNRRRWLEKKWFWENMPGKPENIGSGPSGPGYKKTQGIIALSAVSVVFILLLLLAFALQWIRVC